MYAETLIGNEFLPKILAEVGQAKKTLEIIIFDWRIYQRAAGRELTELVKAVQEARARGVGVRVIANNDYVKDQLRALKIPCKRINAYKIVHAKMILIDENTLILGSHNLTNSAFERNLEISVLLRETQDVPKLIKFFNTLWG